MIDHETPGLWLKAPDDLVRAGYGLRQERESDLPFLRTLYASTRADEMRASGWTSAQAELFLSEQFRLQDAHYRREFPDTARHIIVRGRRPVGRLYLRRIILPLMATADVRLNDISLMPDARGHGVGSALLRAMLARVAEEGASASLTVYEDNRAINLYRRLGFRPVSREQGRLLMHWQPTDGVRTG